MGGAWGRQSPGAGPSCTMRQLVVQVGTQESPASIWWCNLGQGPAFGGAPRDAALPDEQLVVHIGTAARNWWRTSGRSSTSDGAIWDGSSNWWCSWGQNAADFGLKVHQQLLILSQGAPADDAAGPKVHQRTTLPVPNGLLVRNSQTRLPHESNRGPRRQHACRA